MKLISYVKWLFMTLIFLLLLAITMWFYKEFVFNRIGPSTGENYSSNLLLFYLPVLIFNVLLDVTLIQIIHKKVRKLWLYFLSVLYLLTMTYVIFFKSVGIQGFNFNPFSFVADVLAGYYFEATVNLLLFIPVGFMFSRRSFPMFFMICATISLGIEAVQYIFHLGFFDFGDVLLYVVGSCMGYFLYEKLLITYLFYK